MKDDSYCLFWGLRRRLKKKTCPRHLCSLRKTQEDSHVWVARNPTAPRPTRRKQQEEVPAQSRAQIYLSYITYSFTFPKLAPVLTGRRPVAAIKASRPMPQRAILVCFEMR